MGLGCIGLYWASMIMTQRTWIPLVHLPRDHTISGHKTIMSEELVIARAGSGWVGGGGELAVGWMAQHVVSLTVIPTVILTVTLAVTLP